MRVAMVLAAAVLLLSVAPIASADTVQISVNSSFVATISSPNDNFWGEYSTEFGLYGDPTTGPFAVTGTTFSNASLFVPAGSTITSATIEILPYTQVVQGTATLFAAPSYTFPPPGSGPSVAPTFSSNGTVSALVSLDEYLSFPLSPIVNGDEVSTGNLNLYFDVNGTFDDTVSNPGTNWAGYIAATGQIDIPYTVQLDVTYSPSATPEPSSIALLGTSILGLAGMARRKLVQG